MADHSDLGFEPAADSHADLGFTPVSTPAKPQAILDPSGAAAQDPEGAVSRFLHSAWNMINPVPAVQEFLNRGDDVGKASRALAAGMRMRAGKEQPGDRALLEEGMKANLGNTATPPIIPMGTEPAVQAGAQAQHGDLAGAAGTLAGAYGAPPLAAKVVRGVVSPSRAMKVPSSLNPVEQSAVDFLREKDVPLNVGTITGNRFVKSAQAVAQSSPLGAPAAAEAARATEQGMTRVAGELAEQVHPEPVTPESAGASVPKALGTNIEALGKSENEGYSKAWAARDNPAHTYELPLRLDPDGGKVVGKVNMPVDVTDIKDLAQPIFDEMQWMPAAERASSAGYQALKKILEGDDYIPAWQAERGLSGLKTMARVENKSGVRNVSQGIGASLVPSLQANIDASVAATGEDAIHGLQQGRALHASKMEVADLAEKLREEPVQAFNQMTWKQDTGIDFLRKINEQAPQTMPEIGRAFVGKLFDQATQEGGFARARTILNQWENLGPQTKALLYKNPALRSSLDKFFKGAAMVAENPNPSGTAIVNQATSMNPLRWLAGYAGSKLLFSPRGVALLTQALNPPTNPGAAAALRSQIIALAGPAAAAKVMSTPAAGQPPESSQE